MRHILCVETNSKHFVCLMSNRLTDNVNESCKKDVLITPYEFWNNKKQKFIITRSDYGEGIVKYQVSQYFQQTEGVSGKIQKCMDENHDNFNHFHSKLKFLWKGHKIDNSAINEELKLLFVKITNELLENLIVWFREKIFCQNHHEIASSSDFK